MENKQMVSPGFGANDQGRQLFRRRHDRQRKMRQGRTCYSQRYLRGGRSSISRFTRGKSGGNRYDLPKTYDLSRFDEQFTKGGAMVRVRKSLAPKNFRRELAMRESKPQLRLSGAGEGKEGDHLLTRCIRIDSVIANTARAVHQAVTCTMESLVPVIWSATPNLHHSEDTSLPYQGIPRWKRLLDFTCVLITLPCWLTAMTSIALWIKSVSPGPVFYCQERIGYRGKRFVILKFRSMHANAETRVHEEHLTGLIRANCPMKKLDAAGDTRLIPGGRIVRALGLDELPQILNVIRGEMSLVGPRPCTPYEFQHYQPWQKGRVNALPGLTGLWQVRGKNKTTFDEMIQMDLFYSANLSLLLDLQIIFKTVPAIIGQTIDSWQFSKRNKAPMHQEIPLKVPVTE